MIRKSVRPKGIVAGILLVVGVLIFIIIIGGVIKSPGRQATAVVEEFYQYEQKGEFSQSWDLFHSTMKEKFRKGDYIQDRAHVFMNHFGVETFSFTLEKPEKLKKWQMSQTGPELKDVYMITVTQTYKGKYGHFDIKQNIFTVQQKGEWKILWDYNQ